jgi:hypothetical protein
VSKRIDRKLREAINDVKKLNEYSDYSIGIVFIVPYFKYYDEIILKTYTDEISEIASYGADFAGVHFAKRILWKELDSDGYLYPGITVVGKYL